MAKNITVVLLRGGAQARRNRCVAAGSLFGPVVADRATRLSAPRE